LPLFFNQDTYGNGDHFGDFLKSREMNTMSDLFILGSLEATQLASVFEENAEPFLHHLEMIMTLKHYIKANMLELVATQALRTKLTWKKVEANGFRSAHFKIHMRGVHETHVATLEDILRGSEDDDDVELARNKWDKPVGNQDPKPALIDNKVLQRSSINPKLSWNGKINTFDTYKGAIESWAIQHGMDYLIDSDFMEIYSLGSFTKAKREANVSHNITAKQFIHDNKVLYGAIKSSTRVFCPTNQYVIANSKNKDGVLTWYNFNQDYNGENNMETKIADVGLKLEKDYDPDQKGGVLQYLEDMEANFALLAHLDPNEAMSSRTKIRMVLNKLGNCGFDPYLTQALEKDSSSWDGFMKSLRTSLKFVHRTAVQSAK